MKSIKEIMEMIGLQKEVIEKVLKVDQELNLEMYLSDVIALTNPTTASDAKNRLKLALEPDEGNFKILTLMLHAIRNTYEEYMNKGISKEIFIGTMDAFPRFLNEHYTWNKKWAFDRDWWIYRQISMVLFRIGELEFEMRNNEGVKTISVHIPSNSNMKFVNVIEAINESIIFFKKYYPEYVGVDYICRSWLLSSDLDNVLPKTANIILFKSLFTIKEENYNSKSFIKWVYKADYEDYNELPEDTTLQRNLKQYLLAGKSISVAYGVLDFNKVKLS